MSNVMSMRRPPAQVQQQSSPGLNVSYGNGNYDYYNQDNSQQYQNGDNVKRMAPNNPYGKGEGKKGMKGKKPIAATALKLLPWILSSAFCALFILSRHQVSTANQKLMASQSIIKEEVQSCSKRIKDMNSSTGFLKQELTTMRSKESESKSELQTQMRERDSERREWEQEMMHLREDLESKEEIVQSSMKGEAEADVYQAREDAWKTSTQLLTAKIERESYRDALEQFGPGPHTVKFYVDIPRDSEKDAMLPAGEYPSFTIQLYPLMDMPHSIHLFLQQVHHGLWDGCSFVVNAPHILQAGTFPGGNSGATYADKIRAFEEAGLDVVSYQEYNVKHPHTRWTVGFAGRPGGPDFYINKLNNTSNHGPGGQSQHNLEEQADPCFGFIQDGHDVLNRMYVVRTDMKSDWVLDNPVHIVRARIVSENNVDKDIRKAQAIPHLSEMHGSMGVNGIGMQPPNPGVSNPVAAKVDGTGISV